MISIRTSSIDVFRYMRVPHFTYAKLPEAEGTSRCTVCSEVVKHASNASNHFKINACSMHILLSLDSSQHESSSCNMYYIPWCVCMCMLSTYSSCIATSLLLSISIEKVSYRQCWRWNTQYLIKLKYLVSPTPANYRHLSPTSLSPTHAKGF